MGRLDGKVIILLGVSNLDSMGAATARRFAREGASLVLASRRKEGWESLASELGALATTCDIREEADLARLAETAVSHYGRLDGAVNFAGVNSSSMILDVTRELLVDACEVHFIGTALFLKHMARKMANGGSLVTTSSLTALLQPPRLAAYAGSKKGADQIVRIAANEFGELGIRVNAIAPGFTRTEMTKSYFDNPILEQAFVKEIPLGRLGTVEDIANAALWLVSDESASTTGQVLDITSGQSLRRTPRSDELA